MGKAPVTRRQTAVALGLVLVLAATTSPAWGAVDNYFQEDTDSRGVLAHWADVDWTTIPCPAANGRNWVDTQVEGYGDTQGTTTAFVRFGYEKTRIARSDGSCYYDWYYFWEWQSFSGYNYGSLTSITPLGTRDYSLNRLSTDCPSGSAWCWHFRIDGTSYKKCCGGVSELNALHFVNVVTHCVTHTNECAATGLVDPITPLKVKNTTDSWLDWAGKDYACVDYGRNGRGKWKTATSVKSGYNVVMSDSIVGCV